MGLFAADRSRMDGRPVIRLSLLAAKPAGFVAGGHLLRSESVGDLCDADCLAVYFRPLPTELLIVSLPVDGGERRLALSCGNLERIVDLRGVRRSSARQVMRLCRWIDDCLASAGR